METQMECHIHVADEGCTACSCKASSSAKGICTCKLNIEQYKIDAQKFVTELTTASSEKNHDPVNHPSHYTSHPSGVECIQITRYMGFNLGNVIKYIWREGQKEGSVSLEDLKKARWYLDDEILKRMQDEDDAAQSEEPSSE